MRHSFGYCKKRHLPLSGGEIWPLELVIYGYHYHYYYYHYHFHYYHYYHYHY